MRGNFSNVPESIARVSCILVVAAAVFCGRPWNSCAAGEPPKQGEAAAARAFDERIAPLLARRCLQCHNGSEKKGGLDLTRAETAMTGGDSGAAIVAGKPDESYLWERVWQDEMPPKKPLSGAEKDVLRNWIATGAAWGQSPIDPLRYTSDVRAGYDWWALQPVRRLDPHTSQQSSWPRNPIDGFVLARLQAEHLEPSPEADRRTLIRRLTFDLTGLPPTPEEVAAFVADSDPQAYEQLAERLLASPGYGERWARHWLDLARFGESNGFEYDEPRRNAWPYRDWIIGALDRDLPYDEFSRQQLAGDALAPHDPEAIKATGFLVAGAYDTAGQSQQSLAMKAVVRQDELEDIAGTTCQTFLALTVHCARCHDHKFDPIRQAEYYRLTSALSGVRHGERDLTSAAEQAEFARRAAETKARIKDVTAGIQSIDEPVRMRILAERGARTDLPRPPTPMARWDFDEDLRDRLGSLHGTSHGGARVDDGGLVLDGKAAYVSTTPLEKDLHAKTLEVWLSINDLRQAGGGAISIQALDGATFDAIVFAEQEAACWMAGSNNFARTQSFHAPPEVEADRQTIQLAIAYAEDGTITGYRNGRPYGQPYRGAAPVTFRAGEAQVVFGLRHGGPGGNRMLAGAIHRARLYDRALTADELAASAGAATDFVAEAAIEALLVPDVLAERQRLREALRQLTAIPDQPPKRPCYAVTPRQPDPAYRLLRGDIRQPAEVVAAGGVAAVAALSADFNLAPDALEAQRRIALARWITSPRNPLFSRVIANRLWHYHFGIGLVDTPNDFGFNGGRPSHPELLDWLAATLVDHQWSLKQLHRAIVLSATYRQASLRQAVAAKRDADNRWLWRKSPQRLDAEAVRDAVLAVAGALNPLRGGPGFRDCQEVLRSGTYTYAPADPVGVEFNRRSIYRVWTRGGRSALLDTFDCPDPSTTSPKRAVTTTPIQALTLLNHSFVLRMADQFAARLEREVGKDVARQVTRAYQLAFARDPTDDELATVRLNVERYGLSVLARAIFNSNEFLYVD
jgi:hypothetical protein